MKRIHIFCEGQTEETFVRELLYDYFMRLDIFVNPIVLKTERRGKGGVATYGKIARQIIRKCAEDTSALVTTMIDYYGLPRDFPGKKEISPVADSIDRALLLERCFQDDIGYSNFAANLLVHEFEGLLFSNLDAFENWFDSTVVYDLRNESSGFKTPEHINDDPQRAPSKRILKHCPEYEKIIHGALIALDIGLDRIKNVCQHFSDWLNRLEQFKAT